MDILSTLLKSKCQISNFDPVSADLRTFSRCIYFEVITHKIETVFLPEHLQFDPNSKTTDEIVNVLRFIHSPLSQIKLIEFIKEHSTEIQIDYFVFKKINEYLSFYSKELQLYL